MPACITPTLHKRCKLTEWLLLIHCRRIGNEKRARLLLSDEVPRHGNHALCEYLSTFGDS